MAERSGFFNALLTDGVYDRKYNANDYCDNLAVVIGNGVLRSSDDDLRVTASGMTVSVAAGRAWINGHYYYNDAPKGFAIASAPTGGSRCDRIMLRLDTQVSVRSVSLRYAQGTAANNPVMPEPVRSGTIYELVLADIYVSTNASSVVVYDQRANANLCGWVYSTRGNEDFFKTLDKDFTEWFDAQKDNLYSVTIFKRYNWRTLLASATDTVVFDIPQFNEDTTFIEVYVNGVLDYEGVDFTRNGSVLTFKNALIAGTEIVVKAYKSIDGTGIESVTDEITQLQNAVAAMNTTAGYDYICNGVDDNVKLSEIAQAWLNGSSSDESSKTIRVYGTFGARAAYSGSGTSASPYKWFAVGSDASKTRRITFDFSNCSLIELDVNSAKVHHIFAGKNAHIIGARVKAFQMGADTVVNMFGSTDGAVYAEHCYFNIYSAKDCRISSTGTFVNCRAVVTSLDTDAYCFNPQANSLLRVIGGEYTAYTGVSSKKSAVVGQTVAGAVSILDGVNAPTISYSGMYQTNSIYQTAGAGNLNCRNLVSALSVSVISGISDVQGTIARSKSGTM